MHNNRRHIDPASVFLVRLQSSMWENWTFLVSGFGTIFMYLAPISICMNNFPVRMRGSIVGVMTCFHVSGPALFGVIYARFYQDGPIGNVFLPLTISSAAANLLSIWILKPLPLQTDEDIHKEAKTEVQSVCFYTDDGSHPANSWYMRLGIGIMKLPVFHVLSWCFLLSIIPEIIIISNLALMGTSFGHRGLATSLLIYGPILGLLITLAVGFMSDRTLNYVSRIFYVFIGHLPNSLFYILSIFYGDCPYILSGLVLSAFIQNGSHATIIPTLIAEYFGSHYFMRIWGAELFSGALLAMMLNAIIAVSYQDAIPDGGTNCYGLVCFQTAFILGTVMSGVSLLLCGILWYIERKKAQEYERLMWENIKWRQAIIWTKAGIWLIRHLGTNFREIWSEIRAFSFKKMHLKMSSAKWRQFCFGLNVLMSLNFCIHSMSWLFHLGSSYQS